MQENQNQTGAELTAEEEQQKLSEVLQIRRDKLEALKNEGKDPFLTTSYTLCICRLYAHGICTANCRCI